jgi:hypothetical protein
MAAALELLRPFTVDAAGVVILCFQKIYLKLNNAPLGTAA